MTYPRTTVAWLGAVIAVAVCTPKTATAQSRHVLRGQVRTDSGAPLPEALVVATLAPSAVSLRAQPDSAGRFVLPLTGGEGEYLLYVSAVGRRPFRTRLASRAADTTFTVDVRLARAVAVLDVVRVRAARARPSRLLGDYTTGAGTDGVDRTADGVAGALPPDVQGNLDALAALVPGVTLTPNGAPTALGLDGAYTQRTLNGLAFNSAEVPRDAAVTTRFTLSPWDPTRGGFAGLLASSVLSRGGNISTRTGHVTLDHPALQVGDARTARLGQVTRALSLSQGGTGAVRYDRLFYNYGVQVSRRTADVASLASLDASALGTAGVALDSARRALALFGQAAPLGGAAGATRQSTSGSAIVRVDGVGKAGAGGVPGRSWWVTAYLRGARTEGSGLSATATPDYAGTVGQAAGALQGTYAVYFGPNGRYLNETTSGLSAARARGRPNLRAPGAVVLVAAPPAAGGALGVLRLGGNGTLAHAADDWTWEIANQTSFLAGGRPALPVRLYLQSRLDGFSHTGGADAAGTYVYPSLAALEAGAPSSFSRTVPRAAVRGAQWLGAGALAATSVVRTVTWTGGLRADANSATTPPGNDRLQRALSLDNAVNPAGVAISPRLGFAWRYRGRSGFASSATAVSRVNRGAPQVRGGVGRFRGLLPTSSVADALAGAGLPGSAGREVCTGDAVSAPDYSLSTPERPCDGPPTLVDTVPAVTLFDRRFRPPSSWRASLGWTNTVYGQYLTIDGTYALNLQQPSTIDRNFAGTPRLLLAAEGNRPVFVSPASIDPASSVASSVEARRTSTFGPVLQRVSDLRGASRQLTVTMVPGLPVRVGVFTLGYTYLDARDQARGYEAGTGMDPRTVEWSRSAYTPRHQFVAQAAKLFRHAAVTGFARVGSGVPFTPRVQGDVNGDGFAGDRAFVFAPGQPGDSTAAAGVAGLLGTAPGYARRCLARQLGSLAARNSCVGPWSATLNASLVVLPPVAGSQGRARVTLTASNVLGGLDVLVHGRSNTRGWGSPALPDEALLRARGFDATAGRYAYVVNPRFGRTASPAAAASRTPFRLTLDVSLDLGRSYAAQELALNLRERPALRGSRATAALVRQRYMDQNFTDLYRVLVRHADSLALSRAQIERFEARREVVMARGDSIYAALADALTASDVRRLDQKAALARVARAVDDGWQLIYGERAFVRETLTPGQLRLLPRQIFEMVANTNYNGRFFFGF